MEGSQKSECCLRKSSSAYGVKVAVLVQSTSFIAVACTQTLFYFSFRSFGKHRRVRERGEHASEANHTRSTDFEEKIEGLWTGYYSGHCRDLELVSLLASREFVIAGVYISQTFVIYFGLGFCYSPYHRGVRKARVDFILKLGKGRNIWFYCLSIRIWSPWRRVPVIYLTQFSPFNFRNQNPEWHHMFGGVEGANVAMAMARRESLPANMQRPKSPLGKTYSMPLGGVST